MPYSEGSLVSYSKGERGGVGVVILIIVIILILPLVSGVILGKPGVIGGCARFFS